MVFLFILIGLVTIVILFINAKIKIDIKKIKFDSRYKSTKIDKKENASIKTQDINKINIKIKLIILGFIPVFWQTINNKKIEEAKYNKKLQQRYQKLIAQIKDKNIIKIDNFQAIKVIRQNIDIKIKKFDLDLLFAVEDAIVTSFLVPILSTFLAILFYKKNVNPKKQKYKITPKYNSRKFNKYIIFRYI